MHRSLESTKVFQTQFWNINIPAANLMTGSHKQHTKVSPAYRRDEITVLEWFCKTMLNSWACCCETIEQKFATSNVSNECQWESVMNRSTQGCRGGLQWGGMADCVCFPNVQNIIKRYRLTDIAWQCCEVSLWFPPELQPSQQPSLTRQWTRPWSTIPLNMNMTEIRI